ncbi:MAG: tetratricopeptide repeat protein [Bacteroidales bacterium]
MIKKCLYSETIEKYLSDEMSAEEVKRFNSDLLTNKILAKEFQLEKELTVILKQDDIIDFRKKLLKTYHEGASKSKAGVIVALSSKKWYMAAASLAFLMMVGGMLLFTMPGNYSNEALFRKYYTTDNVINVARSGNVNIVEAVIKFQEKDYSAATKLFSVILKSDNINTAAWFYNGIACIETRQYQEAIKSFNHIVANKDSYYIEHAEWYLGLCYLVNNENDRAMSSFQKIASEKRNVHKADAQMILTKLQKK